MMEFVCWSSDGHVFMSTSLALADVPPQMEKARNQDLIEEDGLGGFFATTVESYRSLVQTLASIFNNDRLDSSEHLLTDDLRH